MAVTIITHKEREPERLYRNDPVTDSEAAAARAYRSIENRFEHDTGKNPLRDEADWNDWVKHETKKGRLPKTKRPKRH